MSQLTLQARTMCDTPEACEEVQFLMIIDQAELTNCLDF
jgi:hypothetical protein